jgi:hypothetical protein
MGNWACWHISVETTNNKPVNTSYKYNCYISAGKLYQLYARASHSSTVVALPQLLATLSVAQPLQSVTTVDLSKSIAYSIEWPALSPSRVPPIEWDKCV